MKSKRFGLGVQMRSVLMEFFSFLIGIDARFLADVLPVMQIGQKRLCSDMGILR